MTPTEILLQRFIDQELAPDERIELIRELDRAPALRRRLLELEMVAAEARRLPRLTPRPGFTAQVLANLPVPRKTWLQRLQEMLWMPHVAEWNMAGAAVAVALLLVLAWSFGRLSALSLAPPTVAVAPPPEPQVIVRLIMVQPGAKTVAVAGDFNGWDPARTPLLRADSGMWTATIKLRPGRYQYMFVIDGKEWQTDPLASEVSQDGFGQQNAVLDVDHAI
jgi:anti-sigma factor RsiW